MRKFLVKLVAVETALLGWLSYWLFLVYANNPVVSQGLSNELNRFPQISYTTIDISTIVIIAIFSILVAIKFDRGLRPGMKLERALQMLESLMKRNLFLESQLAEYRIDKPSSSSGLTTLLPPPVTQPAQSPTNSTAIEPGSWEKAFRTPIEAGPSTPKITKSIPSSTTPAPQPSSPIQLSTTKVVAEVPSKDGRATSNIQEQPRPSTLSSSWEDSPRKTMENTGIISVSQPPARRPLTPLPTQGASTSSRTPYIPVPAARAPPLSVITGITSSQPSNQSPAPTKPGVPAQARPTGRPSAATTASPIAVTRSTPQPSSQGLSSTTKPTFTKPTTPSTPKPTLTEVLSKKTIEEKNNEEGTDHADEDQEDENGEDDDDEDDNIEESESSRSSLNEKSRAGFSRSSYKNDDDSD